MKIGFTLNGADVSVDVEPEVMLLEVLRDHFGLRGARATCGLGVCGVCTVLVDGEAISSCIVLAPLAAGRSVTTIEALDDDDPLVRSFDRAHAFQCGFCIPGMVLTAKAFLAGTKHPSTGEIREAFGGNLCRCGCYRKIVAAVASAAEEDVR